MKEELMKVAKETGILPILYPTMCFTLAPDMYEEREDGKIELRLRLPLAKVFARAILRACDEKEREITVAALVDKP